MFDRLKRKRDEEPLVPHGLIWQATEEQLSEPMKSPAQKPSSVTQAREPFELPVKPAPACEDQNESARPLGAISPPLQWPSPSIQTIHRGSAIPNALPGVNSGEQSGTEQISAASSAAAHVSRELEAPKLKIVAKSKTSSVAHVIPRLRSALNSFASRSRSITRLVLQRAVVLKTAAVRRYETAKIGDQLTRARNFAGTQLKGVSQNGHKWAIVVAEKARVGWNVFAHRVEPMARNASEALGRIDTASVQRALRRAWNLKVTVRIPASDSRPLITIARRTQSQWYAVRAWATRDSRLLISFAMGALSAILAVGLVTTLRHFEPATSRGVVAADSKGADTSTQHRSIRGKSLPKKQKSSPALRNQTPPTVPQLTTAAPDREAVHTVRPKPRRSDDEDYIAKDTYVYYGSAGKPTRQ